MKLICLVLVFAIAYIDAAPTEAPVDYREKYDQLLIELINDRIRQGEQFLQHLSKQLDEFRKTKSEEVRENINKELDFILPLVKETDKYFENELKKTGLDLSERYIIEKAKSEADIITAILTEVQKEVAKKPEFFAATSSPLDYRQEYDRLLYQTIEEHIVRADGALLGLNRQLEEYTKTKSADLKARILSEIELMKPFLTLAEENAQRELKRTDLDTLERFLYEKAADEIALLLKHYNQIETAVNAKPVNFIFFADPSAAPVVDWRSQYDQLLFAFIEENVKRADDFLVHLVRQVNEYQKNKDKALLERIVEEIEFTLPFVKRAIETAETELKRTDLDQIERYLYEKVRDEATILNKYYTALETEVKKP